MISAIKKIVGVGIIATGVIMFIWLTDGKTGNYWTCNSKGVWTKRGNPTYPQPIISCTSSNPLPKNQTDCLNQGGVWKKKGPDPFETCNRKAVDRGNLCRDSAECEGTCQVELTKDEMSRGMRGKVSVNKKYGQCSVWVDELGCNGIMTQGSVQVICVD